MNAACTLAMGFLIMAPAVEKPPVYQDAWNTKVSLTLSFDARSRVLTSTLENRSTVDLVVVASVPDDGSGLKFSRPIQDPNSLGSGLITPRLNKLHAADAMPGERWHPLKAGSIRKTTIPLEKIWTSKDFEYLGLTYDSHLLRGSRVTASAEVRHVGSTKTAAVVLDSNVLQLPP